MLKSLKLKNELDFGARDLVTPIEDVLQRDRVLTAKSSGVMMGMIGCVTGSTRTDRIFEIQP